MPPEREPIKSVTVNVVANGYQVYANPKCGPSQTYVFETFDSLEDWLDENLEIPGRCDVPGFQGILSGQGRPQNVLCPTVGGFDYWAAP